MSGRGGRRRQQGRHSRRREVDDGPPAAPCRRRIVSTQGRPAGKEQGSTGIRHPLQRTENGERRTAARKLQRRGGAEQTMRRAQRARWPPPRSDAWRVQGPLTGFAGASAGGRGGRQAVRCWNLERQRPVHADQGAPLQHPIPGRAGSARRRPAAGGGERTYCTVVAEDGGRGVCGRYRPGSTLLNLALHRGISCTATSAARVRS